MAASTEPVFAVKPLVGIASFSAANTARDGSGTINDALTVPTDGAKINRIKLKAETDLADGVCVIWISNGTTYYNFLEVDYGDPAAGSTTAPGYEYEINLADRDINLPAGYKVAATSTVAPTTGKLNVFVFAGGFAP